MHTCSMTYSYVWHDSLTCAISCISQLAKRWACRHYNALQHCNNTPRHTATHCNALQDTATHCNTLQHTAILCNTLQHTATNCNTYSHLAPTRGFRNTPNIHPTTQQPSPLPCPDCFFLRWMLGVPIVIVYIWRDSFTCVTYSFICAPWLNSLYHCHAQAVFSCNEWLRNLLYYYMCDMTHLHVWHDSIICSTWLNSLYHCHAQATFDYDECLVYLL